MNCSGQSSTGKCFSLSTFMSTVSIIPPMLNTHLYTRLTRRMSGKNLDTRKLSSVLLDIMMHWTENYFPVFWSWEVKIYLILYFHIHLHLPKLFLQIIFISYNFVYISYRPHMCVTIIVVITCLLFLLPTTTTTTATATTTGWTVCPLAKLLLHYIILNLLNAIKIGPFIVFLLLLLTSVSLIRLCCSKSSDKTTGWMIGISGFNS